MSALQESACLKRMTPFPDASDAAVIKAFAGIPGLLEQAPASMARGRALDCEWQGAPGVFKGDLYFYRVDGNLRGRMGKMHTGACPLYLSKNSGQFRRYIAPVLNEILEHSTTSTKQGAHV